MNKKIQELKRGKVQKPLLRVKKIVMDYYQKKMLKLIIRWKKKLKTLLLK